MSLIYTVPQSHCVIIERFGKFARVQETGIRFKLPIIEKIHTLLEWDGVATKQGYLLELTEQQSDTDARSCHTADNVTVLANASLYWRVTDARKAVYEVDILPRAINDIALNSLRSHIGSMDLDQVLTNRQLLNERVAADLAKTAQKWGVIFTRVEIQELTTDDSTAKAMLQQMEAERRRRAQISDAEGQAKAEIMVAEADRDAMILRAKGQAEATIMIAEAEKRYIQELSQVTSPHSAAMLLAAQKYIAGFEKISDSPSSKVFLPNNFNGIFSLSTEQESPSQKPSK